MKKFLLGAILCSSLLTQVVVCNDGSTTPAEPAAQVGRFAQAANALKGAFESGKETLASNKKLIATSVAAVAVLGITAYIANKYFKVQIASFLNKAASYLPSFK